MTESPLPKSSTTSTLDLPHIDNLRGALWMLGSSMCSATSGVMIKILTARLPTAEITFLRCLWGLSVIVPVLMRHGWRVYHTARVDLHLIRIVCSSFAILLGIYSVSRLHLATAVSLSFTRPLFMIILALVVLGEKVHWRRGLATIIGFVGVLVVLGPTDVSDLPAAAAALIAAACTAGTMAVVRKQSAIDGTATILVWYATGICVTTALPAYFVWQAPRMADWGLLMVMGIVASMGQYLMIQAFTVGEATVVNPVDYSQILVTTTAAYFLFAEVPTIWTVVGVAIIIASTLYIVLRDAALRKLKDRSA